METNQHIDIISYNAQLRRIRHIIDTGFDDPRHQQTVFKWFQTNRVNIKRYWNYNDRSVYSQYYGNDNRVRYGLYAPILDRFIAVDKFDLHTTHLAAKLLSSKIVTVVCMFSDNNVDITHANSLLFGISHKSFDISASQTPTCIVLDQPDCISKLGWPKDYSERISNVLDMKMWAHFTLSTLYAALLTDRFVNRNDHLFYYNMLHNKIDSNNKFKMKVDGSGIEDGLITYISRSLYNNNTIGDVVTDINNMHFINPSHLPRNTTVECFYSLFRGISTEIDDEVDVAGMAEVDEVDDFMLDM